MISLNITRKIFGGAPLPLVASSSWRPACGLSESFVLALSLSLGDQGRVLFGLAKDFSKMGANGLAFAVRVTRQVDSFRAAGSLLKVVDTLSLPGITS